MLNKIMKVILIVSYLLILTTCDPRIELSDSKCVDIYDTIVDEINNKKDMDFVYYDYSIDFLLIKKENKYYSNRDLSTIANDDSDTVINCILNIVINMEPVSMSGYLIDTDVKYTLNLIYDFDLIKTNYKFDVTNMNMFYCKDTRVGVEITINENLDTSVICFVVGEVQLSDYQNYISFEE